MDSRIHRLFILSCGCMLSILADVAAGQVSSTAQATQDGLIRSELSLGVGRSATVAFAPAAVSEVAGARIGSLQLDGVVRLGALELGEASTDSRYDLSLERTGAAWQIQVTHADSKADVGRVPLAPQQSSRVAPALTVALFPTAQDAAELLLRWNNQEAAAELRFMTKLARRASGRRRPPVSRQHLAERARAEARAQLLSQNNLTALVLADGRGLTISYSRGTLNADGPDFARLASAVDGTLIELTQSPVPSLRTDAPLRFGSSTLATDNLAPGFRGSYGLWLKRAGDGWHLVFNDQADVWGTQHDAETDAMEIELSHLQNGDASRPFGAAVVADGNDRGHIILHWGPHSWSAEFQAVAR